MPIFRHPAHLSESFIILVLLALIALINCNNAFAVPSFSRQTGEPCSECHGTGKIQMGDPPLDVKCEGCSGVGTVPAKPDTLKATLADVAATHAQNKAEAEKPVQEGDGHPEVEKLLAKAKKSKGKKEPVEGNGTSVDTSHGPDESF